MKLSILFCRKNEIDEVLVEEVKSRKQLPEPKRILEAKEIPRDKVNLERK